VQIHQEAPTDVIRYLDSRRHVTLEEKEPDFHRYIGNLKRFVSVDERTRMLEIGTGLGWFPLLCRQKGLSCKGLEISPALIEHARSLGRARGIEPDIELGNIEEADLGESQYDVIIAYSVFEHVQRWERGIRKVFRALNPGGVLLFESTNKFSLRSGEYDFPLYGWLPDSWRYRLRIARQGEDIMKLGIDFNQFTYGQLRRAFRRAGFSRIYDRIELADPLHLPAWKRGLATLGRRVRPLGSLMLFFSDCTIFVCIK